MSEAGEDLPVTENRGESLALQRGEHVNLALFVWMATGIWVNFDAHARGSDYPAFWGVFAPVSGVILLYYLLWWRRGRSREYPPSRWERSASHHSI